VSKAKKRPVRHAEKLTSTPYKNQLQETGGKATEAGTSVVRRKLNKPTTDDGKST